ncbi:hypothetical protein Tco_1201932 [Tanacetum coccineum]
MEELDKVINERVLKNEEVWMKEKEVQALKKIKKWLKESELQQQESLVIEGTTLEANLSTDDTVLEACLDIESATLEACLVNEGLVIPTFLPTDDPIACLNKAMALFQGRQCQNFASMGSKGNAIGFENENRSYDKESSSSEGNDANDNIGPSYDSDTMSEVPHDMLENVFTHEKQSHEHPESSLDTYKVNENNSDIIFDLPTMDPVRDKEEYDYVAYEQQRALFASLINNLKRDVEKCNKVNREAQQANVLGFENQNDNVNPSISNKAKELAPCLYNLDKMGKDELSDHKIIFEKELKCQAEKRLKVKQRKSSLFYDGFVYAKTQFEEPPKVPLKRRNVNLKNHLEQIQILKEHLDQAQLRDHDPNFWNSLLMKYFCFVKQATIKFKKQTFSKLLLNQDELFRMGSEKEYEHNVNTRVRN